MNILPGHGVLFSLKSIGIFLVGESGTGKSETVLQLVTQGAVLICDDAPELDINNNNREVTGSCPDGFHGLMHIRDIGIINIIDLFGQQSFKKQQSIDLVIELTQSRNQSLSNIHLTPDYKQWYYNTQHENSKHKPDSWGVPGMKIQLSPGRNIPLLVLTAISQFACTDQQSTHNIKQ
ncbi:MAG: hypothetical protein KZQ83_08250 [gamma proteobacterium symbiont of Taylorina sp.]|nr:hypothetical protein [gamma proteobacterium symbiont of Taylorina sp.]